MPLHLRTPATPQPLTPPLPPTHPQVSIDSNYAALVVGVCVIVGFATSLDRRVNLMDAATPCFLYHALTGRVSGRLYM